MDNIVAQKSFRFAVRIVKLYQYLSKKNNEFVLSKQLLKAGTSIGANIAEAQQAQSRADFVNKANISLKEAYETNFWIRLLYETGYLTKREYASILADCSELERLLISIVKSAKEEPAASDQ